MNDTPAGADSKLCPFCSEPIKAAAIKCKHCGERLDTSSGPGSAAPGTPPFDSVPHAGYSAATFVPSAPGAATTTALGDLPPGAKLGSYVVVRRLGSGGMGTVFEGRHERLGAPVAIKVLASNLAHDPGLIARFEQEARLQANLKHPNIVAVTDFVVDGSVCAFVMELVEGRTLRQLVEASGGRLTESRCKELFAQILSALGYAHDRGVVHRDLKPANIMVSSAGDLDVVKVMDFGVAVALGAARRTATGAQVGTLHYMSPEQCKGAKDVDHRSDVYSLGVTLYDLATGRLPFERDSEYEMMTAHISEEPPAPRQIVPTLSPDFQAAILKAMAKDPAARFQTARHFAAALEASRAPSGDALPPTSAGPAPSTATARTLYESSGERPIPAAATPMASPKPKAHPDTHPMPATVIASPAPVAALAAADEPSTWSSDAPTLSATPVHRKPVVWAAAAAGALLLLIVGYLLSHGGADREVGRGLGESAARGPRHPNVSSAADPSTRWPRGVSPPSDRPEPSGRFGGHGAPPPPASAPAASSASGPSPFNEPTIDWWCLCHVGRVDGLVIEQTSCRRDSDRCQRLEARARQASGDQVRLTRECRLLRAAHPGDLAGGRAVWSPSVVPGCWQVADRCVLP